MGCEYKYHGIKKVKIDIKEKFLKSIEEFGENLDENLTTSAFSHLFIFNEQSEQIYGEKSEIFHLVMVKILYIMKIARPYLETEISFLCRRVSKSDVDDCKNLKRVVFWVKETIDDMVIIRAKSLIDLCTCIGASYAVHGSIISRAGGGISMLHGVLNKKAPVRRLNTRISIETEIVGVSKYLTYNLWLMVFSHGQIYSIMNNIVYQENQSSIRME